MLIALITGFFPHIYSGYSNQLTENSLILFCIMRGYIVQSFVFSSRYLMAMACLDRLILITNNRRFSKLINRFNTNKIIIFIRILFLFLPTHNLYSVTAVDKICICRNMNYMFYYSLITLIIGGLVPFAIMIVSLRLIEETLSLKRIRFRTNFHRCRFINERVRMHRNRDQQVLLMLKIQIIFYLISIIPWMSFLFYSVYGFTMKTRSIQRHQIENFIRTICEIIVYLYPTFSFFIYTLTSKTFRRALIDLVFNFIY